MHSPAACLPAHWIGQALSEPGSVVLGAGFGDPAASVALRFHAPLSYIVARQPHELAAAFFAIEEALASGYHLAGYLTYEAGLALHNLPAHPLPAGEPLLCFGVYAAPETSVCKSTERLDPAPSRPLGIAPMPAISRGSYRQRIATILAWIADGDIYQANFTMPLQTLANESPAEIFGLVLQQQPAPYAAALHLQPDTAAASTVILSFSPELFFRTDAGRSIRTQPMKGTAPRDQDTSLDAQRAAALAADPKNRAEHIMIVDLLRNDLGRICETGTVETENLFAIRSLPTVHQMVSDVRGRVRPGTPWSEIFGALFPSGSITGAPKLRAMQCLYGVEDAPRGVYTGAIGYITPTGESCFSVAIRTLTLRPWSDQWEITGGTGGGIVADSTADGEYDEALLKAEFLRRAAEPVEIIETVRSEAGMIRWLEPHLDRIGQTAADLDFSFDLSAVRKALQQHARAQTEAGPQRIRITLSPQQGFRLHGELLSEWPKELRIRLAAQRTHQGDPALRHKTSFREHYDRELQAAREAGFEESLFANDAGLLTEACITSLIFVRDGRLFTPYVACGALPGILRGQLLRQELVEESLLPLQDLERCEALFLGNSLRGIYPVASLRLSPETELTWQPAAAAPYLARLQQVFVSS